MKWAWGASEASGGAEHERVRETLRAALGSPAPVASSSLFEEPPAFDRDSGIELLSVALGATLYMPADRPALAAPTSTKQARAGVTSVTWSPLEDSIADE